MKLDGDLAKLITAAHKGNPLAQNAIDVIEETERALIKACHEHHIICPKGYSKTVLEEALASGLVGASDWLKAITEKQENLLI